MTAEERATYWKDFSDIYQRKYEEAKEEIEKLKEKVFRLEDKNKKRVKLSRWFAESANEKRKENDELKLEIERLKAIAKHNR